MPNIPIDDVIGLGAETRAYLGKYTTQLTAKAFNPANIITEIGVDETAPGEPRVRTARFAHLQGPNASSPQHVPTAEAEAIRTSDQRSQGIEHIVAVAVMMPGPIEGKDRVHDGRFHENTPHRWHGADAGVEGIVHDAVVGVVETEQVSYLVSDGCEQILVALLTLVACRGEL